MVDAAFVGAGKKAGMELWRIEKLAPVKQPKVWKRNFILKILYLDLTSENFFLIFFFLGGWKVSCRRFLYSIEDER
jgi:antibiotic biosynthesis monooxygenase (ABM) superfamily enzyme